MPLCTCASQVAIAVNVLWVTHSYQNPVKYQDFWKSKKTLIDFWRDVLESLEWFICLFWFVELKAYEIDFALFYQIQYSVFIHLRMS